MAILGSRDHSLEGIRNGSSGRALDPSVLLL